VFNSSIHSGAVGGCELLHIPFISFDRRNSIFAVYRLLLWQCCCSAASLRLEGS